MKCSNNMMKYTGMLHIFALIVAMYGTYHQIDSVKQGKAFSPALAIALTIMLLLRIPNQVCVATRESHGWFSVVGTVVGAFSFAYLAYTQSQQANKNNNK